MDDELPTLDATDAGESRRPERPLQRGDVVGRYVVLERRGAGGMGVVYAAYDPELDRKIALKLLHVWEQSGSRATEGHKRLLREAQTMARLSHPNVITVHDVGEHDGRVFLAMEFVDGQTLAEWLVTPRSWRTVFDVYRRAGAGLAAAHEKGLVHRDFKPDNVMIGNDGRVRVMDFGLARSTNEAGPRPNPEASANVPTTDALGSDLTRQGSVVGTPAYMSPEQHLGLEVGPAADQFSFCVAIWEGLYGERPFAGQTVASLALAVTEGNLRPPPAGAKVPAWVRRALTRGLASQPEQRHPSLESLLAEFRKDPTTRNRILTAAAVVALGSGVAYSLDAAGEAASRATCSESAAEIEADWNPETRELVRDAMLATGKAYALTSFEKSATRLDDYAGQWSSAREQVCLARDVESSWTPELAARAEACLGLRRTEFASLVGRLANPVGDVVQEAVGAAAKLPSSDMCLDEAWLTRQPAAPAEIDAEVQRLLGELAEVSALSSVAAYDEAHEQARQIEVSAAALGYAPLQAAVGVELGDIAEHRGEYDEAERVLESALYQAGAVGADDVAIDAATLLVFVVGQDGGRHADGLAWGELGTMWLTRVGAPDDDIRRADLLRNIGTVKWSAGDFPGARAAQELALSISERALGDQHPALTRNLGNLALIHEAEGDYPAARVLHQRALDLHETTLGSDHPSVGRSLSNLGNVERATGAYADARALHERAVGVFERGLGQDHPHVAQALNNLANAEADLGEYESAVEHHRRALSIRETRLGPEHVSVAQTLGNLGNLLRILGRYDEAKQTLDRGLALAEASSGPDHPLVGGISNNLAIVQDRLGEHDAARASYERSLRIVEKAHGAEHPVVAAALSNLAGVQVQLGAYGEARSLYQRALGILEQALGAEHPQVAFPLIGLVTVAIHEHEIDEAVRSAERAVAVREAGKATPELIAAAHFALAQAMWAADSDRSRAVELATGAREAYRTGTGAEESIREIDAWLVEHDAG